MILILNHTAYAQAPDTVNVSITSIYDFDCFPGCDVTCSFNEGPVAGSTNNGTLMYGIPWGFIAPNLGSFIGTVPLEVGRQYTAVCSPNCFEPIWCFSPTPCGTTLYVNGYPNPPPYPGISLGEYDVTFTIEVKPEYDIQFAPKIYVNGIVTLPADEKSQLVPALASGQDPSSVTWSLHGPGGPGDLNTLGATLNGQTGAVTAGKYKGTIFLGATGPDGCYDEVPIELTGCDGGCSTSSCNTPLGGVSTGNQSVDVEVNLGWSSAVGNAGKLAITSDYPGASLATPWALQYNYSRPDVQVITNAQGLRQVLAPEVLADIVTNSATKYFINLYSSTNVVGMTNGLYLTSGTPMTSVTVESPGGNTNHMVVTQTRQGVATVSDYQWTGGGWQLTTGGGLRQETKNTVWSQNNTVRTVTQVVGPAGGPAVMNGVETYQLFPNGEHPVQEIIGTGPNAQTNTYTYLPNGYLQQVVHADGSWQYYLYDGLNRPTSVFSSYGNQPITTNPALCQETVYDYSTNDVAGSGDGGILGPATPRMTVKYLLGQEVGRSYTVLLPGITKDIQCVAPGAAWNDPNNLVTTTTTYTSNPHMGEVYSVQRPDGTITINLLGYTYANTTNITLNGHPDGSGANIDSGTKTVDVIGAAGQLLSRTVYDVPSGIMLSSESYAYDSFDRLIVTTHLDGTYEQNFYDCCTLSSKLNRDGSYTYYTYDALKRLVTTTYNNITVSNALDADGNTLATLRFGSDGTVITNQISTYDNAGRLVASLDAVGNLTTYTNYFDGSGQTIRQTTYPDLSTRVETYAMDGSLLNVGGTAVHPVRYVYGVEYAGAYAKTILLNTNGTDSQEWTKTYTDMAGRSYKTVFPDNAANITCFNQQGQVASVTDPDGITQLYQYNNLGQPAYNAVDMNQNGTIDFAGADRINFTTNDVIADHGTFVRRSRSFVWATNGVDAPLLTGTVEQDVTGLRTWDVRFGLTSFSQTSYPGNGLQVTTQVAPDGSQTISTNLNGQLVSMTRLDGTGAQIGQTIYGYDANGRQATATDARTGATTTAYTAADQVQSVTTPAPAPGQSAQVTTSYYDNRGRNWKTVLPDNSSVTNLFLSTGELQETYGSRTYPVAYTYDYAGRMKTMQTWQNFAGGSGAAVTTWNYDVQRGFLASKQYNDGQGPAYMNTPAGRLHSRTWARTVGGQPLVTTYGYDQAGQLNSITYNDGTTPNVGYTFDRLGRLAQVTDIGTRTLGYNAAGEVLNDNYAASGLGFNSQLRYGYDGLLRRTNLDNVSLGENVNYSYDAASRLASVSTVDSGQVTLSATYSYLANSPLVGQITFKQNGMTRLTTTKGYDNLNRLTNIVNAASVNLSSAYQYNPANQRTNQLREDGTYWVYQYDSLGQVTSGKKYWSDGTPVAGQQFAYNFDDIGNRKTTASGGDAVGSSLRLANYTNNLLNQITSRDVPGYVEDQGAATNTATVTVNGAAAYQKGNYYRGELAVDNSSSPLYLAITNQGTLDTSSAFINGHVLVAQTPETNSYDADGNLTQDGKWTYMWDAENRLIGMQSLSTIPAAAKRQMIYAYDDQGRRIYAKIMEWNTSSGSYQMITEERYWYDGWNIICRADLATTLVQNFVWGLDLSGSIQGAGGVGGLLMLDDSTGASYYYDYDGNGNVLGLVNANDGTTAAQYDYDPFLGVLRANGLIAKANPFLGSTKFYDWDTELYNFGHRPYKPATGTWLSREPLGEAASCNVMNYVGNDGVNSYDVLGLYGPAGHYYTTYLVARAAGLSPDQAFRLAYWSQYPDLNKGYNAIGRITNPSDVGLSDVQELLHSLTGGDAAKLRNYLNCLIKHGDLSSDDINALGILIHPYGDTYAHAYPDPNQWLGTPRQRIPNPYWYRGKETLYQSPIGHFLAGHNPDYIASDPMKYGNYIDQLYSALQSLNPGGVPDPNLIASLKQAANGLSGPGFGDFFNDQNQDPLEANALRSLLPNEFNSLFRPEDLGQKPLGSDIVGNAPDMQKLIDKIKKGSGDCCPPNK
jgi:RHS repeat-associated protein